MNEERGGIRNSDRKQKAEVAVCSTEWLGKRRGSRMVGGFMASASGYGVSRMELMRKRGSRRMRMAEDAAPTPRSFHWDAIGTGVDCCALGWRWNAMLSRMGGQSRKLPNGRGEQQPGSGR